MPGRENGALCGYNVLLATGHSGTKIDGTLESEEALGQAEAYSQLIKKGIRMIIDSVNPQVTLSDQVQNPLPATKTNHY